MEVLLFNECWGPTDKFEETVVVLEQDGAYYVARTPTHYPPNAKIDPSDLPHITIIPLEAYCPPFTSNLTEAPSPLPDDIYVKKPQLGPFAHLKPGVNDYRIASSVVAEARICEILRQHPHPNIAEYVGCQVENGLIIGICYKKYQNTLMSKVNPEHRGKSAFRYTEGLLKDRDGLLAGVKAGILHLHSLGLVHNDINPANIMLNEDEHSVIIDFNSCCAVGTSLDEIGRTWPWYDHNIMTASPGNDLDAFEDMSEWLSGKTDKCFKFTDM